MSSASVSSSMPSSVSLHRDLPADYHRHFAHPRYLQQNRLDYFTTLNPGLYRIKSNTLSRLKVSTSLTNKGPAITKENNVS